MRTQSIVANLKSACGGVTLVLSAVLVAWGAASSTIAPGCAARDLDVITLIEQHGMAQDIAPERLANAAMAVFAAREACDAGRTEKAIALYDGIIGSLGAKVSQRVQQPSGAGCDREFFLGRQDQPVSPDQCKV